MLECGSIPPASTFPRLLVGSRPRTPCSLWGKKIPNRQKHKNMGENIYAEEREWCIRPQPGGPKLVVFSLDLENIIVGLHNILRLASKEDGLALPRASLDEVVCIVRRPQLRPPPGARCLIPDVVAPRGWLVVLLILLVVRVVEPRLVGVYARRRRGPALAGRRLARLLVVPADDLERLGPLLLEVEVEALVLGAREGVRVVEPCGSADLGPREGPLRPEGLQGLPLVQPRRRGGSLLDGRVELQRIPLERRPVAAGGSSCRRCGCGVAVLSPVTVAANLDFFRYRSRTQLSVTAHSG